MPARFTSSKKKFWSSEAGISGGGGGRRNACVPNASFTFEANPGGAGQLSVQFTDTSEPCLVTNSQIVSWSWAFNDGTGGTRPFQNPFYIFPERGTFPVTLQVTDAEGKVNNVTQFVTVPATGVALGPTAVISQSTGVGLPFAEILFEEASTPGDVPITQVTWNFGDGSPNVTFPPGNGPFNHTFPGAGIYAITLTVTDQNANVGIASINLQINPVIPLFEVSQGFNLHPYNIRIENTTTDFVPTAVFTFEFFEPGPPDFTNPVTANAGTVTSVVIPPGQIEEYQLDGNPLTGLFGVRMTVTDTAQGGAVIGVRESTAPRPLSGPVPSFTWQPTPSGGGNNDIELTSTSSVNPLTSQPIINTDWFTAPSQGAPQGQWTALGSGPTFVGIFASPSWIILRVEDADNFVNTVEWLVSPNGIPGPP